MSQVVSPPVEDLDVLKKIASQIRRDIVRMVHGANSGHPGGSLGCADFFTALYFHIMEHHPEHFDMDGKGEDLFFLSNGHISPVFYSTLARSGYFPVEELETFRKLDSRLQGHPATMEHLPGIRVASGSLGQGLSVALGAALSKKLNNDPHYVFSLHGDGELQEGQNWEAFMFAAHQQVDNIIATIDSNGQQIDGRTDDVMGLGSIEAKLTAFGWDVLHMQGDDIGQIIQTVEEAKERCGNKKPVSIIMHTKMGEGVDFMEDNHKWHGVAPNDDELARALEQLPQTLGDY